MFGMTPRLSRSRVIDAVPVNALIQSAASALFLLVAGMTRSEPPRNVGMYLP